MTLYDSENPKHATWIVVAEASRMRIFESRLVDKIVTLGGSSKHLYQTERSARELRHLPELDMNAEPIENFQMGHDRRGSNFGYTAAERSTVEPHLDVRDEIRLDFMRAISERLDEARKQSEFTRLILVASKQNLGELKRLFNPHLADMIAAEVPKDLAHCKEHELLEHIRGAVSERALA